MQSFFRLFIPLRHITPLSMKPDPPGPELGFDEDLVTEPVHIIISSNNINNSNKCNNLWDISHESYISDLQKHLIK